MGHVGDEDLDVRAGETGVKHEALDAEDQVGRVVAPPTNIIEAEVQDEDVRAVGRDLVVQGLDVLPGRAAVDGEVGATTAGGEERRHGGVVCAPCLGVGRVDVDCIYGGREGAVEWAHILNCRVDVFVIICGACAGGRRRGGRRRQWRATF